MLLRLTGGVTENSENAEIQPDSVTDDKTKPVAEAQPNTDNSAANANGNENQPETDKLEKPEAKPAEANNNSIDNKNKNADNNAAPVLGEVRDNVEPAPAPPPAPGPNANIELPDCVGLIAHTFFASGTQELNMPYVNKKDIENKVKEFLTAKNITVTSIEVDESALNSANSSVSDGSRKPVLKEIPVTVKYSNESKSVKVKLFYYCPPYAGNNNGNGNMANDYTGHNTGKLNVKDPNNYSLTEDQKTKLIADFKKANKGISLENYELTMDEAGKLTIKDKSADLSAEVPSEEFVSAVGTVSDIYVFLDPTTSNKQSTPIPEITVKLRNGDYSKGKFWGTNKPGGNEFVNDTQKKMYFAGMDLSLNGNELKISGKYDTTKSNTTGGARAIGVREMANDKTRWRQSFSNAFMVRVLPTKTSTVIRNIDDTTKRITEDDLSKTIEIDYSKLKDTWLLNNTKGWGFGSINSKDALIKDIEAKVKKQTNLSQQIETKVGSYSVKSKYTTDFGAESPELTGTAIYYTENIPVTLVKNPGSLTSEEINEIKEKVKKANKGLNLEDGDITVNNDGSVEIKITDPNSTSPDKKTKVKFQNKAPLVTTSYTPATGLSGSKVELPLQTTNNYTFPQGTTFSLKEQVTGMTVGTDGKITYNIPENETAGKKTGTVIVKLPGDRTIEVPYEVTVETPSKANLKYATKNKNDNGYTDIPVAFRASTNAQDYPTEIKGKKGTNMSDAEIAQAGKAPKFIGYTYKNVAVESGDFKFGDQVKTLILAYDKLDEIIKAENGKTAPEGYVKVTFKASTGSKVGGGEQVEYFVNPKASVKLELKDNKYQLIGKNANNEGLKVEVPTVVAEAGYSVKYHKEDENNTTTWPFNNYDKVGQTISAPVEFTSQVEGLPSLTGTSTPVTPNGKEQGTALKVENKTNNTTVEVTDKNNQKVQATIDATTGEIKVTPSATTVGPLTVVIKDPLLGNNTLTGTVEVAKTVPSYQDSKGEIGSTVKVKPQPNEGENLPSGVTYELPNNAPTGVTIDKNTGEITVVIGNDKQAGDEITGKVIVKYPDNTTKEVNYKVTVKDKLPLPKYKDSEGEVNTTVKVKPQPNEGETLPNGATYELPTGAPEGVTVDPNTGEISVKIAKNKQPGDIIEGKIVIKYADGTKKEIIYKVTVKSSPSPIYRPTPATVEDEIIDLTPNRNLKIRKPYVVTKTGELAGNATGILSVLTLLIGAVVASKKH